MKMAVHDWESTGGKIRITVKRGVKLKKERVIYIGHFGEECNEFWRKCPHGIFHPEDRPYYDFLDTMTPSEISKILCKRGCFKVNISL